MIEPIHLHVNWIEATLGCMSVKVKDILKVLADQDPEATVILSQRWLSELEGKAYGDGYVYFVQTGRGTPVKIGWTMGLDYRLRQMQTDHWNFVRLLAVVRGSMKDEANFHRRFKQHRITSEWFHPAPEILDFCEEIDSKDLEDKLLLSLEWCIPKKLPRKPGNDVVR